MGWFGRGRSGASNGSDGFDGFDDGLYRGDAPAYMPGAGDQAPSAYVARPSEPGSPPPPPPPTQPPHGPWTAAPGHWAPPAGPAPNATVTVTRRRGPGAGCGLAALIVLVVLVGGAAWLGMKFLR